MVWPVVSWLVQVVLNLEAGDQDLLAVATNAPLPILDPRGFWNLLSKGT